MDTEKPAFYALYDWDRDRKIGSFSTREKAAAVLNRILKAGHYYDGSGRYPARVGGKAIIEVGKWYLDGEFDTDFEGLPKR